MFAVIIISAYLMPLLYMVTTSFEQPSQISTPGAPPWPATPETGTFEGKRITPSTPSRSTARRGT